MKNRLPFWFRQEIPGREVFDTLEFLKKLKVNTVCKLSHCPNLTSCFRKGEFTFMILGRVCTRHCRFCAVEKVNSRHLPLDIDEPQRLKMAVERLGLEYAVITSVTRDDLTDGGAWQFRRAIEAIRRIPAPIKIEVLIPDFKGSQDALREVVEAGPDVIGHNLETVPPLYPKVRPDTSYKQSLDILKHIKELNANIITKSSLILGLGEKTDEVVKTIEDLVSVNTDILILGQYLAPSQRHYPVKEFISIEQFNRYKDMAINLGIKAALSHPLARSSYQAAKIYREASISMYNGYYDKGLLEVSEKLPKTTSETSDYPECSNLLGYSSGSRRNTAKRNFIRGTVFYKDCTDFLVGDLICVIGFLIGVIIKINFLRNFY